jgi:hypothetical protein
LLNENDIADIIFEVLKAERFLGFEQDRAGQPAAGRGILSGGPVPAKKKVFGLEQFSPQAFGAKDGRYYGAAARPRRIFLTDRDLRAMRAPGEKHITVPKGALISPLARDWIDFEGIEIRYE